MQNPTKLNHSITIDEAMEGIHRSIWCHYYSQCLMKAAIGNWKSFTCSDCEFKDVIWAKPWEVDWFGDGEI